MEHDNDIDGMVLALLWLTLPDEYGRGRDMTRTSIKTTGLHQPGAPGLDFETLGNLQTSHRYISRS
jgi:hypothetical protein